MVMEAVAVKVDREDEKARQEAKKRRWRKTTDKENFANLEQFR